VHGDIQLCFSVGSADLRTAHQNGDDYGDPSDSRSFLHGMPSCPSVFRSNNKPSHAFPNNNHASGVKG
jgi:hypothetical protein